MGIISNLRQRRVRNSGGAQDLRAERVQQYLSPLLINDLDDYGANFADIRPIVERFARVTPYAVDQTGAMLSVQPWALQILYKPNDKLSFYEFTDLLASSLLSQPTTYIQVIWDDDQPHLSTNIRGYVFLPPNSEVTYGDGVIRYQWTDDAGKVHQADSSTVMRLCYSMNSETISVGISPAQASKKWATVESYIADYQAGFFKNGAKPDGMFVITANSIKEYEKAKTQLEAEHQLGSRGHHNYTYSYRPTDEQGNPARSTSVEWVSFGSGNRDLAMGELLDKAQERRDGSYGVPAIARGNDATATYSNAQVANANLADKVEFLLMKTWDKFYSELSRMCQDDLDWSISFDYEVPPLADADKVKAETDKSRAETLITLVNAGATAKDAAVALGLDEDWQRLTLTKQETPTLTVPSENDRHHHCDGHCDCHHEPLTLPADHLANRRLPGDKLTPRQKLTNVVDRENRRILAQVRKSTNAYQPTEQEVDEFIEQVLQVLRPLFIAKEVGQIRAIAKEFGLTAPETIPDTVTDERWLNRINIVCQGHDDSIAKRLTDAFIKAETEGLAASETKKLLDKILDHDKAEEFAVNEIINSERYAALNAVEAIAEANNVDAYKKWVAIVDKRTCPLCKAMNGRVVPVSQPFARQGETVSSGDDEIYIDWLDVDVPDAHNRCRCRFVWSFKARSDV